MLRYMLLALLCSSHQVSSDEKDLNEEFEKILQKVNQTNRLRIRTYITFQPATLGGNISYSDGVIVGLDSFSRTGDCTLSEVGANSTYDLHFGLRLLTTAMSSVSFEGIDSSLYFRLRENSLHLRFTIQNTSECHVALDVLELETLGGFLFAAASADFSEELGQLFLRRVVRPLVIEQIRSKKDDLKKILQKNMCSPNSNKGTAFAKLIQDILSI